MAALPIESQKTSQIRFMLNGEETDVSFAPYKTLLEILREDLGHTGTKHGFELGTFVAVMSRKNDCHNTTARTSFKFSTPRIVIFSDLCGKFFRFDLGKTIC